MLVCVWKRDESRTYWNRNSMRQNLFIIHRSFDDKVRTFCTNPSGEVATEYYDDGLAVVTDTLISQKI